MGRQPLRPKRYGNTTVGGRAKVRLGDSRITKVYHVGAVNLTVPEELLHLLQDAATNVDVTSQRAGSNKKLAQQIASRKRNTSIGSSKKGGLVKREQDWVRTVCDEVELDEAEDGQNVLGYVQKLLFKLGRSPLTRSLANCLSQEDALTIFRCAEPDRHESQALVKAHSERAVVVRDHSMAGAFLLSWIIGKNVSAEDVVKFLVNCRRDELVPLLLLTVFIGAYRYYTMRTICRAPTQQFWILEDAYGFPRRISMDVLIDYSVFQRFLHVHYRDAQRTTGAALVEANQFHLMLGSRRGVVIGSTNWTTAVNKIKPGRRVINAVYITSYDKSCFTCNSNLTVTDFGEFHCATCNTFHRDYATFNLQAGQNTRHEPEPSPPTEPTPATAAQSALYPQHSPQETQGCEPKPVQGVTEGKHDVGGIKNLDIRLVPRPNSVGRTSTLEEIFLCYPPRGLLQVDSLRFHDPIVQTIYVELQRFKLTVANSDGLVLPELPPMLGSIICQPSQNGPESLVFPQKLAFRLTGEYAIAFFTIAYLLGLTPQVDGDQVSAIRPRETEGFDTSSSLRASASEAMEIGSTNQAFGDSSRPLNDSESTSHGSQAISDLEFENDTDESDRLVFRTTRKKRRQPVKPVKPVKPALRRRDRRGQSSMTGTPTYLKWVHFDTQLLGNVGLFSSELESDNDYSYLTFDDLRRESTDDVPGNFGRRVVRETDRPNSPFMPFFPPDSGDDRDEELRARLRALEPESLAERQSAVRNIASERRLSSPTRAEDSPLDATSIARQNSVDSNETHATWGSQTETGRPGTPPGFTTGDSYGRVLREAFRKRLDSHSSHSGTVKFFNDGKGFGFIQPDDGGEDLFCHFSAIAGSDLKTLSEDRRVSFEVAPGPKGKQAINIHLL